MTLAEVIAKFPAEAKFKFRGEYIISPAYKTWGRVWTIKKYERDACPLSRGEREKAQDIMARHTSGVAYFTPTTGRPGWNVRASFPLSAVERGLPFMVSTLDGTVFHFSHRNGTVPNAY